jgi:hypothetical protein
MPIRSPAPRPSTAPERGRSAEPSALPAAFALGERHYRRSEESWREAGAPTARVRIHVDDARRLVVEVDVERAVRRFVSIDAENPLDNEPAAINGDGVQLYVEIAGRRAGWLLVPVAGSTEVARREVDGWRSDIRPASTWTPVGEGYSLSVRVPLPAGGREVALDVLVNETAAGRERRRGQLVLSGADDEFVYLRGDRHDPERLLHFALPDA